MITNQQFEEFLSTGSISGLEAGTAIEQVQQAFGPVTWHSKATDINGTYGIAIIGMLEIQFYAEVIYGLCFKPYLASEVSPGEEPWLAHTFQLQTVCAALNKAAIQHTLVRLKGPLKNHQAAGFVLHALFAGDEMTLVDLPAGVSFLFNGIDANTPCNRVCAQYRSAGDTI